MELGRGGDGSTQTSRYTVSEKKKGKSPPSLDVLSRHGVIHVHGSGGRRGEGEARALRLTHIVVRSIMGSRRAPLPARVVMTAFKSCMLTMRTERGVSSRELATTSRVGNLDVDKVGAVMVMVITVVERIKARGSS